ncbi:glycosyltransferase family 4 protein [uncultured Pigmentiphaga sp.]|jgi:Glycosyltransferase|uniref:glycosyltransferase family 4 protein n=1 Tax=uncultured Pigmentiphaga sp. TaxID=340361 RepID=UPI002629C854|nr:glycosyltransferase family 4 protein [uncultured Pigmentiphaga sp.]
MKIALCSSFVPFVYGGARNIVEWLESTLLAEGHQVERIYLPHVDTPERLFTQMAAYRWLDLDAADRVICFRPPAHVVPHPNKVLWFIHHIRAFYDLWDTPYRGFPADARHCNIRDALHDADTRALREARHVFTNSAVVSQRLRDYNGVNSEVLYPPIFAPQRFHCRGFNDEVVYICRVEHHKRQHLLVEAMRYTQTPVRLRLCGTSSRSDYVKELFALVNRYGLGKRVIIEHGWISEEQKVDYLAECLAAAYLPLDEDSYGYPSLEASHAGKPILTTSDAGGVLELVEHGRNGLVCNPRPEELAAALDQLYEDRHATERMGRAARDRLEELDINWARVLNRLLA